MFKKQSLALFLLAVMLISSSAAPASADSDCIWGKNDATMTVLLVGNCEEDQTVTIPDGYTLNGMGFTVTVVDPIGGHFIGPVIRNVGNSAYVKNITIVTSSLTNVCDSGDARLRGILFDGASGWITDTVILGLNQGQSGCQEGNAIEVRNLDGTSPGRTNVVISGNIIDDYQKTGIVANGNVFVEIFDNYVSGFGPISFIAQNGIQLGYGATGSIHDNDVRDNYYSADGWISAGLLFFDVNAPDIKMFRNTMRDNQRNVSMTEDSACPNMYDGIYADWGLCD
jgi:hypothetical protein